ncbi:hypothetical protein ACFL2Y_04980 [Candidatus Omnitrophota bacterium]
MSKKFFKITALRLFILLVCTVGFYSLSFGEVVDKAELAELMKAYKDCRQACLRGDLKAYRRLRDADEVAKLDAYLQSIGRELTAEDIRSRAKTLPILKNFKDIRATKKGVWAQLKFQGEDVEPDVAGERARFYFILLRHDGKRWEAVRIGNVSDRKFKVDGSPVTIDDVEVPQHVKIPE